MKCGVWLGGLVLALGAAAPGLRAQDAVWRPAGQGAAPVAFSGSELAPCPRVALGRPVAVVPAPAGPRAGLLLASAEVSEPALFPATSAPALPTQPAPLPAVAYTPKPGGTLIAVSGQSLLPAAEAPDEAGSEFAVARRGPMAQVADVRRTTATDESAIAAVPGQAPVPLGPPAPVAPAGLFGGAFAWVPHGGADTDPFGPPPAADPLHCHYYVQGEYLLWWLKGDRVPPLVTTSAPQDNGFIGAPTTRVLFGGDSIGTGARNGARFTLGMWLDQWCDSAIEVGGFFLTGGSSRFTASSATNPVLARPFFNVNAKTEFSELVASPGVSTGSVSVSSPSNLWGLNANWVCKVCCGCDWRVNAFAGVRYLNFTESLTVTETIQGGPLAPPPFTNALTTVFDRFGTSNNFYGAQVGLAGTYLSGPWSVNVRGQVALGSTYQSLRIDGSEQIFTPTGVLTSVGGLLALPSNIGSHHHATFSVVPEVGINVGYQVNPHVRVFVGYDLLYWTGVARAGEQIDRNLDVTQIPFFNQGNLPPAPGAPQPRVVFRESDLWAQGLVAGVLFTY